MGSDDNTILIAGFIFLLFFVLLPLGFILVAAALNGGNIQ